MKRKHKVYKLEKSESAGAMKKESKQVCIFKSYKNLISKLAEWRKSQAHSKLGGLPTQTHENLEERKEKRVLERDNYLNFVTN